MSTEENNKRELDETVTKETVDEPETNSPKKQKTEDEQSSSSSSSTTERRELTIDDPKILCHVEVQSKDWDASAKFYSAVFGWEFADMKMGNGQDYKMMMTKPKLADTRFIRMGFLTTEKVVTDLAVCFFVSTLDIDATVEQIKANGGDVVKAKHFIFDDEKMGALALVSDVQGVVFGLWSPGEKEKDTTEANVICHIEIPTKDAEKSMKFYTDSLGWECSAWGTYSFFKAEVDGYKFTVNGGFELFEGDKEIPQEPNTIFHVYTADIDATIDLVKKNGGEVVKEKEGPVAWVKDVFGNTFGLWNGPMGM